MQRQFTADKETKGTFRFKEVEETTLPIMSGAIYIRKDAMKFEGKGIPSSITVTVEYDNA